MTTLDTPVTVPAGTLLERVAGLREMIERAGNEAQQLRRLPQWAVTELVDAGLFRFAIPRVLGGEDASVLETMDVIEAVSAIDGSVGWNLMLGSEINAMAAGGMEPDLAKDVYLGNPAVIMCGGAGPGTQPGPAIPDGKGGYTVHGRSTFSSGCHSATYAFVTAVPEDTKTPRMFFMHRSQWEIEDTWDVGGLRGSGSHDVVSNGGHIPAEHVGVALVGPARHENPVYRIPVPMRLSYNKAAVAIGVAKGALESFVELASTKTPMMASAPLSERPVAQQRMGEALAQYRSARSYLFDAMNDVEEELRQGREWPSASVTQNARLACTHAANVSMHVVDSIHNAAGTTALRMHHPLERKLRDAHGCASHRWVAHPLYGELGRIALGGQPGPEFDGSNAQSSKPRS